MDVQGLPGPGQGGIGRIADIHDVQASRKGVRPDAVDVPGLRVGHDVVGPTEAGVRGKREGRCHRLRIGDA